MLYKEIDTAAETESWPNAVARHKQGGQWWREVAGVPDEVRRHMEDESLFRVFEWGTVKVQSPSQ
jgi:hypothetical protein